MVTVSDWSVSWKITDEPRKALLRVRRFPGWVNGNAPAGRWPASSPGSFLTDSSFSAQTFNDDFFRDREMKVWTKLNVQEIEGRIIVTHRGRRLVRADEGPVAEGDSAGEVVLRVYSSRYVSASKNLICRLS